jgi:hypothetical protein
MATTIGKGVTYYYYNCFRLIHLFYKPAKNSMGYVFQFLIPGGIKNDYQDGSLELKEATWFTFPLRSSRTKKAIAAIKIKGENMKYTILWNIFI